MKFNDYIFAIICGLLVAWIGIDFLPKYGWIFFIILPILSVIGLFLSEFIGKKFLFVHQAGKYILSGAFADVIDIKIFQLFFFLLPFSLILKAISFSIATIIKYLTNKFWAFEKNDRENLHKEVMQFIFVVIIGLLINVASFYLFGKIKTGLSEKIWTELSIILAALVVAVWNFLGYKFIVFKK